MVTKNCSPKTFLKPLFLCGFQQTFCESSFTRNILRAENENSEERVVESEISEGKIEWIFV